MKRSQNVVVGFDGSSNAEAAVRWAARLASQTGARLHIVHAVGLLEHAAHTSQPVEGLHIRALQVAMDAGAGTDEVVWSAVDGDPCSALLRMTAPPEVADLLVVGSRGLCAHGGSVLGSTSLELAEHSTVPVTIVPASYR
jgi:nucleotide-binding universal stress UspA family protein